MIEKLKERIHFYENKIAEATKAVENIRFLQGAKAEAEALLQLWLMSSPAAPDAAPQSETLAQAVDNPAPETVE